MNKTKEYLYLTMLAALAIVINIIENLFIPPLAFGIRFGLANIVSIITIKLFNTKKLLFVIIIRILLANLIKGTIFGTSFWISTSGIILSTIILIILNKLKASILFTSMMSSIFHSIGQMIVVVILYNQINIANILPILIIFSLATGILTGIISNLVLKRISTNKLRINQ